MNSSIIALQFDYDKFNFQLFILLRYFKCVGGDIVKTASQGYQSEQNQVLKLLSCVSPSKSPPGAF